MTAEALDLVGAFLADRRGLAASSVEVAPLSGDASTRRYFRLHEGQRTRVLALYPEPFVPEELLLRLRARPAPGVGSARA